MEKYRKYELETILTIGILVVINSSIEKNSPVDMLDRARSNGKTDFNISIVPSASITISVISIETSELLPPMGCGRRGG